MIRGQAFAEAIAAAGFDLALSVPCSSIAGLLEALDHADAIEHRGATSEAEAVGIAAGAWLAGRNPIVLMQNSGFCESLNVIGSLLEPYQIPISFLVTGRGSFGVRDEGHHKSVGRNLEALAALFGLPFAVLSEHEAELPGAIEGLRQAADRSGRGAVLAIPVGVVEAAKFGGRAKAGARTQSTAEPLRHLIGQEAGRFEAIRTLAQFANSVTVTTTGHTGRELFAAHDRGTNLYLAGSMGCAPAVGLGIALSGDRPVLILDGDGAMLMRMGTCCSVAALRPRRFAHVVLNNGVYASTGGQPTLSRVADLARVAAACGYPSTLTTDQPDAARVAIEETFAGRTESPLFVDLLVSDHASPPLPRPSLAAAAQAARLRHALADCAD